MAQKRPPYSPTPCPNTGPAFSPSVMQRSNIQRKKKDICKIMQATYAAILLIQNGKSSSPQPSYTFDTLSCRGSV